MLSFVCLAVLLGLGYWLRRKIVLLQRLYLPASVIAGLLGLIIIHSCLTVKIPLPAEWTAGWSKMPGILTLAVPDGKARYYGQDNPLL